MAEKQSLVLPAARAQGPMDGAVDAVLSLAGHTADRLSSVLADGDLDDWSRGELSLLMRTYKEYAATLQKAVDAR